jgi:hypothetical protein
MAEQSTHGLVTFSTYARMKAKTVQWVYYLAKHNKIETVEIDGVKFVKL